jgi:hypothetical protein
MRTVLKKFKDPKGIAREELGCGHVITDRDVTYGNEVAVQIRAAARSMTTTAYERRCYKCGVLGAP